MDTNSAVKALAEQRRYKTRLLDDGERVIPARRIGPRQGWWALEVHDGKVAWAFYLDLGPGGKPTRHLAGFSGVADEFMDNRSSDQEVYVRFHQEIGTDLMIRGPRFAQVVRRREATAQNLAALTAARKVRPLRRPSP